MASLERWFWIVGIAIVLATVVIVSIEPAEAVLNVAERSTGIGLGLVIAAVALRVVRKREGR